MGEGPVVLSHRGVQEGVLASINYYSSDCAAVWR